MSFQLVLGTILVMVAIAYLTMELLITIGLIKIKNNKPARYSINGYFSSSSKETETKVKEKLSVLIPVRNEAQAITACLDSLAAQDFPSDNFEIIVSDDFSEDYTTHKVLHWAREHPGINLVLVRGEANSKENQGKKKAIERGIEAASGSIMVCTDADTMHGKFWLRSMVSKFNRREVMMVLGPVGLSGEKGIFQKIQVLEFLGIMGFTAGSANLGSALMCNGANLAYRKQAFMEAGEFTGNSGYHSGDDQFLMMKIRKRYGGKSVVFAEEKEAIVLTSPCGNWNDFMEQRIRWVSKSRGYRDPKVITAGLLVSGFPFLILVTSLAGFFYPWLLLLGIFLWLVKILFEYPLVWLMARFFDKKQLLGYYFSAQVFQFLYSIFVALAGQFSHYSWKGRRLRQ